MEICDNPECRIWLHDECIIDYVLTKAYKTILEEDAQAMNGTAKTNGRKPKSKAWKSKLTGKVKTENGHTVVSITDIRKEGNVREPWDERVPCLQCQELLE